MSYKHGDRNAICDRSGFKCKLSQLRKTWDGLRVLQQYWEAEPEQNRLRVRPERPRIVDGRVEGTDTFLEDNEVTASDL